MQLTYRGSQYELINSGVETIPGAVIGKYRGATLRARICMMAPSTQPLNLFYRGAHYDRPVAKSAKVANLPKIQKMLEKSWLLQACRK